MCVVMISVTIGNDFRVSIFILQIIVKELKLPIPDAYVISNILCLQLE